MLPPSTFRLKVLLLLLSITSSTLATESASDDEYETSDSLSDDSSELLSMETTHSEVIVDPPEDSKTDDNVGEESKGSLATLTKDQPQKKFKLKLQNITEEEYNFVQWYSEPSDVSHHVGESQRTSGEGKASSSQDLNAQGSSYGEGYSRDSYHAEDPHHHHYEDYHKHDGDQPPSTGHRDEDHHHYDHGDAHVHSFHHKSNPGDKPGKRRVKKIRKKCNKDHKNEARYPGSGDAIVHSMSKGNAGVSHFDSSLLPITKFSNLPSTRFSSDLNLPSTRFSSDLNLPSTIRGPNFHSTRFSSGTKLASVLPLLAPSGLTGPHLHSTPRARYFDMKTSEKGNHLHVHNHHHHYNAEGKRIGLKHEPPTTTPVAAGGYGNLMQSLGKLRSLLPLALAGMAGKKKQHGMQGFLPNQGLQGFQQNQEFQGFNTNQGPRGYQPPQVSQGVHLPTENGVPDVKLAADTPKKGYHYTGPHKSYGRKTYYRMKDGSSSSSGENSFGYGSGEASQDVAYPNEGSYNIAADMMKYGTGPYATDEFHHDSSGERHYPNEVTIGVDKEPDSHSNTGYTDAHSPGGYSHTDSHSPNSYNSYSQSDSHSPSGYNHDDSPPSYHDSPSAEYDSGLSHEQKNPHSLDYEEKAPYVPYEQLEAERAKEGGYGMRQNPDAPYEDKDHPGIDHPGPPSDHSLSYVQDGVDQHFYDPEKDYMYRDLKPEPDPMSIPKNARVIEHHIRLHPLHYTLFQPIDLDGHSSFPAPQRFQQHIPVHKLIPNPLKVPNIRVPPTLAAHPSPQLNDMLHAYQSRNVYHRWW